LDTFTPCKCLPQLSSNISIDCTNSSIYPVEHATYSLARVRKGDAVNPPLSWIFYKNFITYAKEINCFRIYLLGNLSTNANTTE